jgi:ubiquinone/menaquinone biosynthesis C-methylase UbiE
MLRATSRPQERGEYSAGYWQAKIRKEAVALSTAYSGRLLEVGCGEGFLLKSLHEANLKLELWGVDSWGSILNRARELFAKEHLSGIKLIESDAKTLPFEDGFFDAVVCINVFLNVKGLADVRLILAEMARVCKSKGRLVIEFRNALNPFVVLKFNLARYYDETIRTRRLPLETYQKKDITAILEGLGFSVVSERCLDFPFPKFAPVIILEAKKYA